LFKRILKRGVSLRNRPSIFFLLIFLSFCSCAGPSHIEDSKSLRMISEVPFYRQESYQCGPASLAGVLNYWGTKVSPEQIAREIFSPSAGGTLNLDMILYAEKKGMKALHYQGSVDDIRSKIDLGYPVIVLIDLGFWLYQQNHFMVVVGYYEKGIVANSGKDRLKPIPLKDFIKTWERTNFWTLLVTP